MEKTAGTEWEEIGVHVEELQEVAELDFVFTANPEWGQKVTVFIATKWEGEPTESEEMAPKWYDLDKIPYTEMWQDDIHWLPQVLEGKKIKGTFYFGEGDTLEKFDVTVE